MSAHRAVVLAALLAGGLGSPTLGWSQQAERLGPAAEDSLVYVVQAGDTPAGITERYLGGAEAMAELMGYNQIADPNTVREGSVLVIPLGVRAEAIDWVLRAEREVAAAHAAAADTYASEEVQAARRLTEQANQVRQSGDYSRTVALSKRGRALAERARRLADERAPIQQGAVLSFVYGRVEKGTGEDAGWLPAAQGDTVPVGTWIRTGPEARAEITLAEGSKIQLQQQSRFQLTNFRIDRRTGVRSSRLKVHAGGLLGTVEPEKVRESEFEIDTGAASVAIRGTRLRVVAEERDTRLSVLAGMTGFRAGGEVVEVPERFGALSRDGRPPKPPVELLPPPGGLSPRPLLHRTADQTPLFQWQPVVNPRTGGYRLEIAEDEAFHQIVQDHRVTGHRVQAGLLSAGRYFWRVLTMDRDGIEGEFTERRGIEIEKHLAVVIRPTEPLLRQGGMNWARPQVGYVVRPARTDTSVVRMWYSVDGVDWAPVEGAISLREDGEYAIQARGECGEGERGPVTRLAVRIDGTPPAVTARIGEATEVEGLGPTVFVNLTAKDPAGVDRVEFGFDGRSFAEYTQPLAFSAIERARLYFRAVDAVGNVSPVQRLDLTGEPAPR